MGSAGRCIHKHEDERAGWGNEKRGGSRPDYVTTGASERREAGSAVGRP